VVYTTNALESVHAQLRKIIKTREDARSLPERRAATKRLWLALRNITKKWESVLPRCCVDD